MDPTVAIPTRRQRIIAIAVLSACCAAWGLSFPLMQVVADGMARASLAALPLSTSDDLAQRIIFTGWRFAAATVLYGSFVIGRLGRLGRRELVGGLGIGLVTAIGLVLQMTGLRYALPSLSAVLTALCVIVAPLAQSSLLRQSVRRSTWVAALVAFAGVVVLGSGNIGAGAERTFAIAPAVPWLGEMLTLSGTLAFTAQILMLDHWGKRGADPELLTLVMFATCATACLIGSAALGDGGLHHAAALAALASDRSWVIAAGTIVALCTALAMWLMIRFQPVISPAAACVVYCLEPVFATMASIALRTERLTTVTIAGGGLIIVAVIAMAWHGRRRPGPGDCRPSVEDSL